MKTEQINLIEIVNREKENITNKDLVNRLRGLEKRHILKRGDLILIDSKERGMVSKFYYGHDPTHINYWSMLLKNNLYPHVDVTHKNLSDIDKIYKIKLPTYIKE